MKNEPVVFKKKQRRGYWGGIHIHPCPYPYSWKKEGVKKGMGGGLDRNATKCISVQVAVASTKER